jgi:putative membrane protein insertion efficiency factor
VKRSVGQSAARGVIFVIQLYRHTVSPLRLPTCRFTPTCSQYAVDALSEYGLFKGGWLAVVRLLKCGPWHRGGWDPVPERCAASELRGDVGGPPIDPSGADHTGGGPGLRVESETRV